MSAPRVVVGVPLYNNAPNLRRALESLLVQTYPDYALVLVDDASTDATEDIVRQYAALDDRITYERNERRLGMIGNWRRAFELAERTHDGFEYFAWGSDHDVWHPRWVAALSAVLDEHPEVALTYPQNDTIGDRAKALRTPWRFDTFGIASPLERLPVVVRGMAAGNMVYGLARAEALRRCGVFRDVLLPDRLLLTELAAHGQFKQVPAVLWTRRLREGPADIVARQRRAFFPSGRPPLHSYLPWWITHTVALAWSLGLAGRGPAGVGRLTGLRFAARHFGLAVRFEARRQLRRGRRRIHKRLGPFLQPLQKFRHAGAPAPAPAEVAGPPRDAKVAKVKGSKQPKPPKDVKRTGAKKKRPPQPEVAAARDD